MARAEFYRPNGWKGRTLKAFATKPPAVGVAMPVRNAMPFLDKAIESILSQTYGDFELTIGDDGSDDGSSERLEYWEKRDSRIRLFRRDIPSGPANSSNWVVELSRAELVARMDADDIAHPDRLARQLAVFESDPSAVLVGSTWIGIDSKDRIVRPADISALLQFRPFKAPFAHGSIMLRKAAFEEVGGYREECDYWEDIDFFHRLAQTGKTLILVDPLYRYRFSATSNRLHAQPTRVERQLALQLRCRKAIDRGQEYEEFLHSDKALEMEPPLRVFQQRAGLSIWAGYRSNLIFEWLKRRSLKSGLLDPAALVYLVWGAVSPRSLRWVLGRLVNWRNGKARRVLGSQKTVDWDADRANIAKPKPCDS